MLDRLRALDACAVSDALDTLGLPGAVTGIRPLWPVGRVVAGRARTVQAGAEAEPARPARTSRARDRGRRQGDVLVIANGGRTDVSCFGGILTQAAVKRGMAGVAIDGACRDIAESEELDLPIFGRAVVPVSARGRIVQIGDGRADPVRRGRRELGRLRDRRPQRRRVRARPPSAAGCSTWPSASSPARRAMAEAVRAGESVERGHARQPLPEGQSTEARHERAAGRQRPLDRHALGRARQARPAGQPARHRAAARTASSLVGPAYTVRYRPAGHPPGTVGDYLDDVPPGQVRGARQRRPHRLHGLGRHPHRGRAPARASVAP